MSSISTLDQPYKGQKFKSFDALKKYLEEYGQKNYVKFWIRSSHTRNSLKSKISKTMNPDLKYVCVKFACIFGGEKIRCRGSGIRKSSTYRDLGCPCMINAVVGEDGNHVKLDTVILEHNHVLCKTLYDSIKKTKRKNQAILDNKNFVTDIKLTDCQDMDMTDNEVSYLLFDDNPKEIEYETISDSNNLENTNKNFKTKIEPESTPTCLQTIEDKYGKNIKILVVDSNNSFDNLKGGLLNLDEKENEKLGNLVKKEKNEVCRLCLSSEENLTPIFNPNSPLKSTVLSFKIMGCASIEISSDDGLPNNICTTCEADLDIAYNFRLRCENSDSILRRTCLQKDGFQPPDKVLLQHSADNISEESESEETKNLNLPLINDYEGDKTLKADEHFNDTFHQNSQFVQFATICPICTSEHDTYESLIDHLGNHSENEALLLSCNICNSVCPSIVELQSHMKSHLNQMGSDRYGCFRCDAFFTTLEDLKSHEEEHEETVAESQIKKQSDVNYLCNICGKILKTKDRFRSHKNTHEGLRPHVCLKCGRGFADRKNMHHHYNVVHLRKPKLECPVCQKKFYTRTKMKSHVTMHYGVKPFTCDICGKTFRLKMNMIKHKKTHSNDRPHKCDKCSAAFIDKNMLKRHSYIHGGIRPYPCPICGHRFSVKFHLKKHLEKSKCSASQIIMTDNYQWIGMSQPEQVLPSNECVIVYRDDENSALQGDEETITMNILQEYQEESIS